MRGLLICAFALLAAVIVFAQFRTTQKNLPAGALERPIYEHEGRSLKTPEAFRASILNAKLPGGTATSLGCREDSKRQWNHKVRLSLRF